METINKLKKTLTPEQIKLVSEYIEEIIGEDYDLKKFRAEEPKRMYWAINHYKQELRQKVKEELK